MLVCGYTHVTDSQLKDIHKKFHSKGGNKRRAVRVDDPSKFIGNLLHREAPQDMSDIAVDLQRIS